MGENKVAVEITKGSNNYIKMKMVTNLPNPKKIPITIIELKT
jgi:hypothetical protein